MTDSKELVELAKRGGLEMTQGSSVGVAGLGAVAGDSVAGRLEFEHLMDLDAGLAACRSSSTGPRLEEGRAARAASDGLGPAFAMDFEDPEGAAPASHAVLHDVVPGEQAVGGLFLLKGPFGPRGSEMSS